MPPDRVANDGPIAGTLERDRIAELALRSDEALASLVPAAQPGCSAAVAVDGESVWAGAGGLADLAAGTPVTTETRFDIASVSKQFTATAILMLQREGLLVGRAIPIGAYVDGLPAWGSTVTLDQLIHHTSRIPDYWVELDEVGIGFADAADQQTTLQAIRRERKLEPGTGYLYSNSNYVLLAEVVARVSGLTLPDFLAQRVFTPLGLDMVVARPCRPPTSRCSYDDQLELQESGWTAYGHTGIITTAVRAGALGRSVRRARGTSSRTTSQSARWMRAPASSTPRASTSRSTATSTTPAAGAATSPTSRCPPTAA